MYVKKAPMHREGSRWKVYLQSSAEAQQDISLYIHDCSLPGTRRSRNSVDISFGFHNHFPLVRTVE